MKIQNVQLSVECEKTTTTNDQFNSTIWKITHGAGRTLASTDASSLPMLMPNSFA